MIRKHIVRKAEPRRNFLKMAGGCAALTNTSLLSTIFNLSATNAAVAENITNLSGYKALVCVFLFGGNDSFNLLSPLDTAERADYEAARGGVYGVDDGALGLPLAGLHAVTDAISGRNFAIHPGMPEMKTLYDQNKLCFLANVGSLVQPTTMAQYQAQSNLPLGLFSHADLQRHWMTSVPQTRSQVDGWAGRMADCVTGAANPTDNISMNIALNGVNMWQTGKSVVPYIVTSSGASEVGWYGQTWTQAKIFTTMTDSAFNTALGAAHKNLVEKTFAKANKTALDAAIAFNEATSTVTFNNTVFPNTSLGDQLQMVAKSISARSTIGHDRQIFFVAHHGYDNHDELVNNQQGNLSEVSQALKAFYDATAEMQIENDVVTFTASDFARTLNSNGQGSDHAWGGNQIIMGGSVDGGKVHGQYPDSLAPGNDLDLGRGRLLPTTSVDEMSAELAMWYGVPNDNNLEHILPNIRNFPSANTGTHPIGILS